MKINANGTKSLNLFPGKVYSLVFQGMVSGQQVLIKSNGVILTNGTITSDTDVVLDPAPAGPVTLVTTGMGSGATAIDVSISKKE